MQNEIKKIGKLLNEKGELNYRGFARELLLEYNRNDIKAKKLQIKEWDYYLIYNEDYAVALTLDDNSYMGLVSVSLINFKEKWEITNSPMSFMPKGKTNMPSSSKEGDVSLEKKNYRISFCFKDNKRILDLSMDKFTKNDSIKCHFELSNEPIESMVIVTPFKDAPKAFYYNQKIVGFLVDGFVEYNNQVIKFNNVNTRGILDWGRGVWIYKNTWYWGAAAGTINNHEFGFNIGYGFGDTSAATENVLFYDGIVHKLNDISFNIPRDEKGNYLYTDPWTFTSSDKRFEMQFEPIIDRKSKTDVLIICSDQHQVFGKFTGTAILDNGEKINIKDFVGFAERVYNKW